MQNTRVFFPVRNAFVDLRCPSRRFQKPGIPALPFSGTQLIAADSSS